MQRILGITLTMRHKIPVTTANAVRACRLSRNMSQLELAKKVGVSRQTIIAIERAECMPSISVALQLATALQVPLESLFWINRT